MRSIRYTFISFCFIFFVTGFSSCFVLPVIVKFRETKEPDYSKKKYWSALPQKKDSADAVIPNTGMKNEQSTAKVDVFFVHPTTYIWGRKWNADIEDTSIYGPTDRETIKTQATVFNGSCKVYVPRYRLAQIFSYFSPKRTREKAFDLAYGDIKRAFEYYLKHYNNNRPFIIAAHSQGSDHAIRLCKEMIDNNPELRKKMVVAYLIGSPIVKNTFENIPPCDSASQTQCFAAWYSVRWGELTFYGKPVRDLVCVNPLSWKRDEEYVPASENKGSVPLTFNRIDTNLADAKISPNGLLWIHHKKVPKKDYPGMNSRRSYHVLDYSLFYMNIRENTRQRIDAYLKLQK